METASTEAPWRAGLRALNANKLPALVLPLFALALVLCYYHIAPLRDAIDNLAALRQKLGRLDFLYGIVGTALFGGLIPLAYLKISPATRNRYTPRQAAAVLAFWAWKGFEVYIWYALLTRVIGTASDLPTALLKMFCDQFVYCAIWAIPLVVVIFNTIDNGLRPVLADMRQPRWYIRRVLPVLVTNLAIWIPSASIVFMLPVNLQQLLFNLVICFFTLLMSHMSQKHPAKSR